MYISQGFYYQFICFITKYYYLSEFFPEDKGKNYYCIRNAVLLVQCNYTAYYLVNRTKNTTVP